MDENQKKDKNVNAENQEEIKVEVENITPEEAKQENNETKEESVSETSVEGENNEILVIQQQNEEKTKRRKKKKEKKPRKGSYILGTIGAILGGIVAALPWVLTYTFANNLVIPVLATLIPIGAFLGYKIFRGKIKKGFTPIVTIISLLIIVTLTTIICPTILAVQSGYEPTWENLKGLYSDTREEVRIMIIEDSLIGLLFTVAGIILISHFIRKQIKSLISEEELKAEHEAKKNKLKEQTQLIKNACLNLSCFSEEKAVKKKIIIKELKEIFNVKRKKAKLYFKNALLNGFLKKHKGKYYYDETEEEEKLENFKKIKNKLFPIRILITIIILLLIAIGLGTYIYINTVQTYNVSDSGIQIKVDNNKLDFYGTEEDMTNAFGEGISDYYDFIILDKNNKYEIYGMTLPKSKYEDKDFATIMQEDRDYWSKIFAEQDITISETTDKEFGENTLKEYNYTYTADSGKDCRAVIYLYQGEASYLWINVYADIDVELKEIDEIIENLVK